MSLKLHQVSRCLVLQSFFLTSRFIAQPDRPPITAPTDPINRSFAPSLVLKKLIAFCKYAGIMEYHRCEIIDRLQLLWVLQYPPHHRLCQYHFFALFLLIFDLFKFAKSFVYSGHWLINCNIDLRQLPQIRLKRVAVLAYFTTQSQIRQCNFNFHSYLSC